MAVLSSDDFATAFTLARSEAGRRRNSQGVLGNAAVDAARFDHSASGQPRGLLTTAGSDLGTQDRVSFDPLMLPAALTEDPDPGAREATVYHAFRPLAGLDAAFASDQAQFTAGIVRRAFYSRDAVRTVERLMAQEGHHIAIGVHAGFAENRDGFARYRGQLWQLPNLLSVEGGVLAAEPQTPLINSGAEFAGG